jgi:hypothetical protein
VLHQFGVAESITLCGHVDFYTYMHMYGIYSIEVKEVTSSQVTVFNLPSPKNC